MGELSKTNLITPAQALKDVERWLDYKKIGNSKREINKDFINMLADAVADGDLVLEEDFKWKYTLKFPLENESPVRTISFMPRVSLKEINEYQGKAKASSGSDVMVMYLSLLSGVAKEVIRNFDTEDFNLISSIGIFFM